MKYITILLTLTATLTANAGYDPTFWHELEQRTRSDINYDNKVNEIDEWIMVCRLIGGVWQQECDINEDGQIDTTDYTQLVADKRKPNVLQNELNADVLGTEFYGNFGTARLVFTWAKSKAPSGTKILQYSDDPTFRTVKYGWFVNGDSVTHYFRKQLSQNKDARGYYRMVSLTTMRVTNVIEIYVNNQ